MIAKHSSGAEIFHLVVLWRTRSVSVDVVDLIEGHACIGESVAYAVGDRNPVRFGTGTMESVCQFAAAGDHAQDLRAARLRGVQALQHERPGTFSHHESLPVLRKGLRCATRVVVVSR